jgi:hypothetical protein
MSMEDAEQWEQSMQRELASLYKNQNLGSRPSTQGCKGRQISLGIPYKGEMYLQSTFLCQRLHPTMA